MRVALPDFKEEEGGNVRVMESTYYVRASDKMSFMLVRTDNGTVSVSMPRYGKVVPPAAAAEAPDPHKAVAGMIEKHRADMLSRTYTHEGVTISGAAFSTSLKGAIDHARDNFTAIRGKKNKEITVIGIYETDYLLNGAKSASVTKMEYIGTVYSAVFLENPGEKQGKVLFPLLQALVAYSTPEGSSMFEVKTTSSGEDAKFSTPDGSTDVEVSRSNSTRQLTVTVLKKERL
jgi:hypothetical protein